MAGKTLGRIAAGIAIPVAALAMAASASASVSPPQQPGWHQQSGLELVSGYSRTSDVPVDLSGLVSTSGTVSIATPDTTVITGRGALDVQAGQAQPVVTVDRWSCYTQMTEYASLTATGGTGAFRGAQGDGSYQLTFTGFSPRSHFGRGHFGRCAVPSSPFALRHEHVALSAELSLTVRGGHHRHHRH